MKVILELNAKALEIIQKDGITDSDNKINNIWAAGELFDAIDNAVTLPDNATNGDVIKAMFPDATVYSYKDSFDMYSDVVVCPENSMLSADRDFWNAPYKGGQEQ